MKRVLVTIVCLGKAINITYHEFVFVVLVIQTAKRMRLIMLSTRPLWLYQLFPHYLIKDTIFAKIVFNIKLVFRFSTQLSSENCFILGTNKRDTITEAYTVLDVKCPFFLSDFNEN